MPRFLRVFLITLSISVAFLVGIYFGGHYYRVSPLIGLLPTSVRSAFFPGEGLLQLQREVEGILRENYYRPVDQRNLEDGAMEGLIGSLGDPYSAYYSPDDYARLREHTEGQFVGIGVMLEMKDGELTVVSPIEGSPAAEAGVEAGDVIVAVNGEPAAGKTDEEVAALVRGEAGTTVVIRVRRAGSDIDFEMQRRKVEIPVVAERMIEQDGNKIGYAALETFSELSGSKLRGTVDRLLQQGAQGIVLDLRYNGGGLLEESVEVASIFIENGTIVSVVGRDGQSDIYEARGDANETVPLIVLINNYTASASEIVSGAVKDDSRGKLVGDTTFGKGLVQVLMPLSNGGALKYTSAAYHTPAGTDINEVGIEPDIAVADDPATPQDEQLDRAIAELL